MLALICFFFTVSARKLSATPTEIIGYLAAFSTTAAFIPQVLHVWKRKSARDISLGMFLLFSVGVLLWLIYGVLIASRPIEIANGITLALSLAVLILKLRYDRNRL